MHAAFYHIEMCFLNFSDSTEAFPSKLLFCHFPGHFSLYYNYFFLLLNLCLKEKYYYVPAFQMLLCLQIIISLAFLLLVDAQALVRCKTEHRDQSFQVFLHHLGSLNIPISRKPTGSSSLLLTEVH